MYTFESRISYSQTDSDMRLRPDALADYYQDCSTFQTIDGPVGLDILQQRGLAWVINSWQIEIHWLPVLGERVITGTMPYEMKGFMGLRNFFMETPEGERLSGANSVWSLIDIEKGTPTRVTPDIEAAYPLDERLDMEYLPRKINFPEGVPVRYPQDIEILGKHLDSNLHVNNVSYIRMALDMLGELGIKIHGVTRIRAEYRLQARLSNIIKPSAASVYADSDTVIHTVSLDNTEKKPYAVIEITDRIS